VIPTRGNVDLDQIVGPLPFDTIGVWDNSTGEDLGVFGRYAAINEVTEPVILTQDDDVILPAKTIDALLRAYEPGKVVCNIPQRFRTRYKDSGMVGFGAIFDRGLPERAFVEMIWPILADGDVFKRTCDLVFTMLTPMVQVDLPYVELAYGKDATRMWRQPGHFEERDQMRKLCRQVRDG